MRNANKTGTISIRLPMSVIRKIEDIAEEKSETKTEVARNIVLESLEKDKIMERIDQMQSNNINAIFDVIAEMNGMTEDEMEVARDNLNSKYQSEVIIP